MNDTKKRKRRLIINIVLLICVLWELIAEVGYMDMKKYSLEANIAYERNPLKLVRVEIINREDLNAHYQMRDAETLYEVRLTAQNPAAYNAGILDGLKFRTEDGDFSLYTVYPEALSDIGWYADREVVVPAHRTGSVVCFLTAPKDSTTMRILEEKRALSGERGKKELTFSLPKQCMETTVWEDEKAAMP